MYFPSPFLMHLVHCKEKCHVDYIEIEIHICSNNLKYTLFLNKELFDSPRLMCCLIFPKAKSDMLHSCVNLIRWDQKVIEINSQFVLVLHKLTFTFTLEEIDKQKKL